MLVEIDYPPYPMRICANGGTDTLTHTITFLIILYIEHNRIYNQFRYWKVLKNEQLYWRIQILILSLHSIFTMQIQHRKQEEKLESTSNLESKEKRRKHIIFNQRHSWIVIEPWTCSVAHATMKINGVMK